MRKATSGSLGIDQVVAASMSCFVYHYVTVSENYTFPHF